MIKKETLKQFSKFVVTGVLNTGIDFSVLYLLMWVTGKESGIFTLIFPAISFSVATVNSFFLNKYWTFSQNKTNKKEEMGDFGQFLIITLGGLFINSGLTFLISNLTPFLGATQISALISDNPESLQRFWVLFSKAIATGVSLIWNFFGYKFWVFNEKGLGEVSSRVTRIEK